MKIKNYLKAFPLALLILTSCDKKEEELNTAPVIENQVFEVLENITSNQKFADVVATDVDKDELLFSIKENDADLFQISESGELSVAADKGLDFETKTVHKITVEVSDGAKLASAEITIKVTDVDENEAPVIENQTFTVAEDISDTDIIGTVVATDPNGDDLSYTVSDANFEITGSGELSLIEGKQFDYETKTEHTLTVEVSDGAKSASAEITIKVTDVDENEAPVIENQTFTVAENISATDLIGAVVATDDSTARLSFVMKADADNLFRIFDNGTLYLIEGKQLDYETKTSHTITVEVSDGEKTATADITIKVTDVVEDTVVNIPDANFKQVLVTNNAINTNGDSEIQVSEAENYTGVVSISGKSISDLTGIEYFTSIKYLYANGNNLKTINLSKNVKLLVLYINNNPLTSIDVSNNVLLEQLRVGNTGLTSLDVSSNTNLNLLWANGNNLSSLNLTQNTLLQNLVLYENKLTSLDLSKNTSLESVNLSKNELTSLDVSNKATLKSLNVNDNKITTLNVNNSTTLTSLFAHNNQLTTLDTSTNFSLYSLAFARNKVASINLTNNTRLINLYGAGNLLTDVILPETATLKEIYLASNKINSIDVSKNVSLKVLAIDKNELTSLDLSKNGNLSIIDIYTNKLTKVNVANGNNANVTRFSASDNIDLTCITIDSDFKPGAAWNNDNGADAYTYTTCP